MNTFSSVVNRVRLFVGLCLLGVMLLGPVMVPARAESDPDTRAYCAAKCAPPTPTPCLNNSGVKDDNYLCEKAYLENNSLKAAGKMYSSLACLWNCHNGRGDSVPTSTPDPSRPTPTPGGSSNTGITQGLIPDSNPIPSSCTSRVDAAVDKVVSNPSLIDIYKQASASSGTPWEIIAAIHYIEANNRPEGSCISGRKIGDPEPDQNGRRYSTLLESCLHAAQIFETKKGIVKAVAQANSMSTPSGFEMFVGQFDAYNAFTQSECAMVKNASGEYTTKYAGGTWPGIPDTGQCSKGPGGKGEKIVGDRHVYPMACYDSEHENMYFHFHYGEAIRKYDRIGALAFIKGLQKKISSLPAATPTPDPNVTPIIYSGLTYFPQCGSPAFPSADTWSSLNMPGCGSYCGNACGIASMAMIYSSYSGNSTDPLKFMNERYGPQGAAASPNCLYARDRVQKAFADAPIEVGEEITYSGLPSFYSTQVKSDVDGHLDSGRTLLLYGDIKGYNHFIWIVGKEKDGSGNPTGEYVTMDPYWSAPPGATSLVVPYGSSKYTVGGSKSFVVRRILPVKKI